MSASLTDRAPVLRLGNSAHARALRFAEHPGLTTVVKRRERSQDKAAGPGD